MKPQEQPFREEVSQWFLAVSAHRASSGFSARCGATARAASAEGGWLGPDGDQIHPWR